LQDAKFHNLFGISSCKWMKLEDTVYVFIDLWFLFVVK